MSHAVTLGDKPQTVEVVRPSVRRECDERHGLTRLLRHIGYASLHETRRSLVVILILSVLMIIREGEVLIDAIINNER